MLRINQQPFTQLLIHFRPVHNLTAFLTQANLTKIKFVMSSNINQFEFFFFFFCIYSHFLNFGNFGRWHLCTGLRLETGSYSLFSSKPQTRTTSCCASSVVCLTSNASVTFDTIFTSTQPPFYSTVTTRALTKLVIVVNKSEPIMTGELRVSPLLFCSDK